MCHVIPQVLGYIPGSLKYRDKNIEVVDLHHVKTKQKVQVQIKMYGDNEDPFIATLHNVLLAQYLCDKLFSIIKLINLEHTCFFQKSFCAVYFDNREKNAATSPHNALRKHAFWGEIK